jgi:hypothetical protein
MKLLHLALAMTVLSLGAYAQGNGPAAPGKQKESGASAKPYAPGQKKQPGESAKAYSPGHSKDAKKKKGQANGLNDEKKSKNQGKDNKP